MRRRCARAGSRAGASDCRPARAPARERPRQRGRPQHRTSPVRVPPVAVRVQVPHAQQSARLSKKSARLRNLAAVHREQSRSTQIYCPPCLSSAAKLPGVQVLRRRGGGSTVVARRLVDAAGGPGGTGQAHGAGALGRRGLRRVGCPIRRRPIRAMRSFDRIVATCGPRGGPPARVAGGCGGALPPRHRRPYTRLLSGCGFLVFGPKTAVRGRAAAGRRDPTTQRPQATSWAA